MTENSKEIRVNISPTHTAMSTYHLWDKTITLKAKGLLSQMLSLPKEWDYSIKGLANINKESMDSINSALRELKNNGYLTVTKQLSSKENGGKYKYTYDVYELPQIKRIPEGENPAMENPYMEVPPMENPNSKERKEAKERKYTHIDNSCDSFSLNKGNDDIDSDKDNHSTNNLDDVSIPKEIGAKRKTKTFVKPTVEEVRAYCLEKGYNVDPEDFVNFYESKNWYVGINKMVKWKSSCALWANRNKNTQQKTQSKKADSFDIDEFAAIALKRSGGR